MAGLLGSLRWSLTFMPSCLPACIAHSTSGRTGLCPHQGTGGPPKQKTTTALACERAKYLEAVKKMGATPKARWNSSNQLQVRARRGAQKKLLAAQETAKSECFNAAKTWQNPNGARSDKQAIRFIDAPEQG